MVVNITVVFMTKRIACEEEIDLSEALDDLAGTLASHASGRLHKKGKAPASGISNSSLSWQSLLTEHTFPVVSSVDRPALCNP